MTEPAPASTKGNYFWAGVAVKVWLCIAAVAASGIRKFFDDTPKPRVG